MTAKQPVRILLVEDDSAIAHVIAIGMRTLGVPYQLDQALSAEEGLELWQAQPYDLVLTDYNLRGMNGISLINQIHADGIPVSTVLFTAYDSPRVRREAQQAHVGAFIAKPFVIEDFIEVARGMLPLQASAVGS
ncbi:MAG TPA: response regulator [Roseiflexaceae bacterium]|nr:response regulator [Roseiflexaceae bacterium]HMP39796.1 response regulator [Roseiflexaceae bacterium]